MQFKDNDPVFVLKAILNMILEITEEVYTDIEFSMNFKGEMSSEFKDNLNLCSVYIDMGIITIFTDAMCAYGAAAAQTPEFSLKGSGDIVLKADKSKEFYVTQKIVGGSPAGAIHEKIATVEFGIKAVKSVTELGRSIYDQIKDSQSYKNFTVDDDGIEVI
jgi:hypothetical protein